MGAKVFVLGRPGSGKSTVARRMIELAGRRGYQSLFVQDYDILYKMFLNDKKHERFRPAGRGGFDVIDYTVLDTALQQMEKEIENVLSLKSTDMVCIEFARNDYRAALRLFSPLFLRNAYFFFIDSDLESCIQRVQARVTNPPLPDHHFVSEYVMRTYYNNNNNWEYMSQQCKEECKYCEEVIAVHNDGPLSVLMDEADDFAERIFRREFVKLLAGNRTGSPSAFPTQR